MTPFKKQQFCCDQINKLIASGYTVHANISLNGTALWEFKKDTDIIYVRFYRGVCKEFRHVKPPHPAEITLCDYLYKMELNN